MGVKDEWEQINKALSGEEAKVKSWYASLSPGVKYGGYAVIALIAFLLLRHCA